MGGKDTQGYNKAAVQDRASEDDGTVASAVRHGGAAWPDPYGTSEEECWDSESRGPPCTWWMTSGDQSGGIHDRWSLTLQSQTSKHGFGI